MSGWRWRNSLRSSGRNVWQAVTEAKRTIVPVSVSRRSAQIALQLLPALQRLAGVRGEAGPLRRQPHRAAIPLEERPAGLALEPLHRAGEGRGADVAGTAGAQEMQRAREVQEEPERVVVHGGRSIAETATESCDQSFSATSGSPRRADRSPGPTSRCRDAARQPSDDGSDSRHGAVTKVPRRASLWGDVMPESRLGFVRV